MLNAYAKDRTLSPVKTRATARSRKSIELVLVIAAGRQNLTSSLNQKISALGIPNRFIQMSSRSGRSRQVQLRNRGKTVASPRSCCVIGNYGGRFVDSSVCGGFHANYSPYFIV